MPENYQHTPVLKDEVFELLALSPGMIYLDCTLGAGGHLLSFYESQKDQCTYVGIDQDDDSIQTFLTREEFEEIDYPGVYHSGCFYIAKGNFRNLQVLLHRCNLEKVDRILMDLGVSSHQLDTDERGFSFNSNEKLDMRMDNQAPLSAYEVVNEYSENQLKTIFKEYGEERFAGPIAKKIVQKRLRKSIISCKELSEIIGETLPSWQKKYKIHPSTRVFQAIRIEVNQELTILKWSVEQAFNALNVGGRLGIITFHSLEDRIVKECFQRFTGKCDCSQLKLPACICGASEQGKLISRKPVIADEKEIKRNNRSRSAKFRVIEKLLI